MAFVAAHNILSPLGSTSAGTFEAIVAGRSAVAKHPSVFPEGEWVWASKMPADWADAVLPAVNGSFSQFEKMLIASIKTAKNIK